LAKGVINMEPNSAGALCYAPLIGPVAAIVFLLLEKNQAVRWHAVQALLLTIGMMVATSALRITIFLGVFIPIVWLAGLITQLVLVIKTYQGQKIRLPYLGEWSDKLLKKTKNV